MEKTQVVITLTNSKVLTFPEAAWDVQGSFFVIFPNLPEKDDGIFFPEARIRQVEVLKAIRG